MIFEKVVEELERADGWLASYLHGPFWIAAIFVMLLGLRHATDPDHLVAVTELIADDDPGSRRAARLGAAWGAGHALSLLVVGVPMVLLKQALPDALVLWCERLIGAVIIALAIRLFVRWIRGLRPSPPHIHARPVRTPLGALTIGALHGLAGSAGAVLLVAAAARTPAEAILFLLLFAPMSFVSMVACSVGVSWTLRRSVALAPMLSVPVLCLFSLLFGVWYIAAP